MVATGNVKAAIEVNIGLDWRIQTELILTIFISNMWGVSTLLAYRFVLEKSKTSRVGSIWKVNSIIAVCRILLIGISCCDDLNCLSPLFAKGFQRISTRCHAIFHEEGGTHIFCSNYITHTTRSILRLNYQEGAAWQSSKNAQTVLHIWHRRRTSRRIPGHMWVLRGLPGLVPDLGLHGP